MKKPKQMNAGINADLAKKLQVQLLMEGCSYRQWLEDRIDEYLQGSNKSESDQGKTSRRKKDG